MSRSFTNPSYLEMRALTSIFFVAAFLNAPWEVAQLSLYVGKDGSSIPWWHCVFMGFGDAVLVLVIVFIGWIVLGRLEESLIG